MRGWISNFWIYNHQSWCFWYTEPCKSCHEASNHFTLWSTRMNLVPVKINFQKCYFLLVIKCLEMDARQIVKQFRIVTISPFFSVNLHKTDEDLAQRGEGKGFLNFLFKAHWVFHIWGWIISSGYILMYILSFKFSDVDWGWVEGRPEGHSEQCGGVPPGLPILLLG